MIKFHSSDAEELRKAKIELDQKLAIAEKECTLVKLERDDLKRRLERAEQQISDANELAAKKAQELLDMTSQNFFLQERAKSLQRQQEEVRSCRLCFCVKDSFVSLPLFSLITSFIGTV